MILSHDRLYTFQLICVGLNLIQNTPSIFPLPLDTQEHTHTLTPTDISRPMQQSNMSKQTFSINSLLTFAVRKTDARTFHAHGYEAPQLEELGCGCQKKKVTKL